MLTSFELNAVVANQKSNIRIRIRIRFCGEDLLSKFVQTEITLERTLSTFPNAKSKVREATRAETAHWQKSGFWHVELWRVSKAPCWEPVKCGLQLIQHPSKQAFFLQNKKLGKQSLPTENPPECRGWSEKFESFPWELNEFLQICHRINYQGQSNSNLPEILNNSKWNTLIPTALAEKN